MSANSQNMRIWSYAKENPTMTILSFLGMTGLLGITFFMWHIATITSYDANLATFDNLTQDNEHAMLSRIDSYRQSLDGGAALFEASDDVSLDQWKSYVEVLNIEETLPGINGIGFIVPVQRSNIDEYFEQSRSKGVDNIDLHPETAFSEILAITYIEPLEPNKEAVGLDIGFETNRREAAYHARDTGKATITKRIDLVQDETKSAGFLLLRPMYEQGRMPAVKEQRQDAFRGWIYAPFIASRLMAGLTNSQGREFDIEVYDSKAPFETDLIFASNNSDGSDHKPLYSITRSFPIMEQNWTVIWNSTPEFEASVSTREPVLVLLGGIMLSLAVLTLMFFYVRREAYVRNEVKIKTEELVQKEREVRNALADAKMASKAKSTFLANMSHEIRTPMNGVIGFTQLLDDGNLNDKQQRYVQMISDSGSVMMNLLNDILDISKVDAGQMTIKISPMDLGHIVQNCMKMITPTAETKELELIINIDPSLPKLVQGDGLRLRQVILNLLANAVKFTQDGHVKLDVNFNSIEMRGLDQTQQPEVVITVSDTGIGIAPDRQVEIFKPFQQADDSTARKYGGTGLGLSISHQLVQLMGGHIKMSSALSKGSTFTVIIPVDICEDENVESLNQHNRQTDDPLSGSAANQQKARILVAEDHDVNQMLLSEMLTRLGIDFEIADNGSDAIAIISKAEQDDRQFDLVLMDIQMPVIDGLKATEIIRRDGISAEQLPIVALTANAYEQDISDCLKAGMQAHLAKPFSIDDLQDLISSWIDHNRAAKAA